MSYMHYSCMYIMSDILCILCALIVTIVLSELFYSTDIRLISPSLSFFVIKLRRIRVCPPASIAAPNLSVGPPPNRNRPVPSDPIILATFASHSFAGPQSQRDRPPSKFCKQSGNEKETFLLYNQKIERHGMFKLRPNQEPCAPNKTTV